VEIDLGGAMRAGKRHFLEMGALDGYFGDPRTATVAEGDATYAKLAGAVVTVVAEALNPPREERR
jgi:hypothetical protein